MMGVAPKSEQPVARLSSAQRDRRQRDKLRRSLADDAMSDALAMRSAAAEARSALAAGGRRRPPVFDMFVQAQQKTLRAAGTRMGLADADTAQLLDSQRNVRLGLGLMRATNKKVRTLDNNIRSRLHAASSNCLFKLATCSVCVAPWAPLSDPIHALQEFRIRTGPKASASTTPKGQCQHHASASTMAPLPAQCQPPLRKSDRHHAADI